MVRIDKQQGLIALGRFKSCVRTSLLLCGGYECQEKEGTFMIAFPYPRAAVEWALTLQLALLRCDPTPATRSSPCAPGLSRTCCIACIKTIDAWQTLSVAAELGAFAGVIAELRVAETN